MTEYVRIPIREDEHERLVKLQTEWTGQINSYLTRPSLSDVIKKLLDERTNHQVKQQEIKTMNTQTYRIDEQMLGDEATVEDARRMVEILTERGYIVEYGHSLSQDEDAIANKDWDDGLDIISRDKYAA